MEGFESSDDQMMRMRDALKTSLLDSLQYVELSQISIVDLTKALKINRSTFQAYYTDKYDLLDAAIEQATTLTFDEQRNIEQINDRLLTEIFTNVVTVLEEMKNKYALNFEVIVPIIEKKIKSALQQIFLYIGQNVSTDREKNEVRIDRVALMLSWGIYGAALDSLEYSEKTAQDYINPVMAILINGLKNL